MTRLISGMVTTTSRGVSWVIWPAEVASIVRMKSSASISRAFGASSFSSSAKASSAFSSAWTMGASSLSGNWSRKACQILCRAARSWIAELRRKASSKARRSAAMVATSLGSVERISSGSTSTMGLRINSGSLSGATTTSPIRSAWTVLGSARSRLRDAPTSTISASPTEKRSLRVRPVLGSVTSTTRRTSTSSPTRTRSSCPRVTKKVGPSMRTTSASTASAALKRRNTTGGYITAAERSGDQVGVA